MKLGLQFTNSFDERELVIDSGCFGHVCPPWFAPQFPVINASNIKAMEADDVAIQNYRLTVVYGHMTANSGRRVFSDHS